MPRKDNLYLLLYDQNCPFVRKLSSKGRFYEDTALNGNVT